MTTEHYQTSTDSQQLELPLEYAPEPVRAHGLRAAHRWPRVGRKDEAGEFWSGRVPASHAWAYRYIELADAGSTWALMTHDCDDRERMAEGLATSLPPDNWMVRTERGAHVTWCLEVPVAKHHAARQGPETYLARVAEYFHHALGADPAFSGLGRNPVHPDADTIWGREEPYSLDGLSRSVVPFNWRMPRIPQTGIGRNRDMFIAGCRGAQQNPDVPALTILHTLNQPIAREWANGSCPTTSWATWRGPSSATG